MSTKRERDFIIEKCRELAAKGYTQRQIAETCKISVGSVNAYLKALKEAARENISHWIDTELPHSYELTLIGIDQILRSAWTSSEHTHTIQNARTT